MRRIKGMLKVAPLWGGGLLVSLMALIGVAPFALFISEFLTVRAAWNQAAYWPMGLLLFGLGLVFIGVLRKAIPMAWEPPETAPPPLRTHRAEALLAWTPLALLLLLGLWIPPPLRAMIAQAAAVLGVTP